MNFEDLRNRLTAAVRNRIHNGELSERRLAHLTGISQPHVHNVLKGARILSLSASDQVLHYMGMSILDLLQRADMPGNFCSECSRAARYVEVPVLEGWLGPCLPLPRESSSLDRYPLPQSHVARLVNPVVARLAADPQMTGVFRENDLVLLDRSTSRRLQIVEEGLYVVSRQGEGVLRRLRRQDRDLLLLTGPAGEEQAEVIPLEGRLLLDIVVAWAAWIGRSLLES